MRKRTGARQQRGLAIAMTSLALIPLMIFAAFGVDLAGWYARISFLQRAADAAALAGTVWMPNLGQATTEATNSLRSNGIVDGVDGIDVLIERGATPTSLRVELTDTDADRFFSRVLGGGNQSLTRHAEAEYKLPLPLGSPLNYFGGDAARTAPTQVFSYAVSWPTDYATRVPVNGGSGLSCNVGTASPTPSGQNLGRWNNGTYGSGFSGTTQCRWTVVGQVQAGAPSNIPPPDYSTRQPTNSAGTTCWVRTNGGSPTIGRWQSGVFSTNTSGTSPACTWTPFATVAGSIPSFYTTVQPPSSGNRPCRVGYQTTLGWWPSSGSHSTTSVPVGGTSASGNRLCEWAAGITATDVTPPNPIASTRSPGFWAAIEGPRTNAYQGDIYSTRCYDTASGLCAAGTVGNAQYMQPTDANRGFWYVVKIPAGLSGSVALNVFDASYIQGATESLAGDRGLDSDTAVFPTQFQVYRQTNPLDFGSRTALFSGAPNTTNGSCNWSVGADTSFQGQWRNLCNLSPVSPGQLYLINVQTTGTTGAGVNGYALEAVANGTHVGLQPALYAFGSMAMQNNNFCTGAGCVPPPATFYLAEVGPQYAGRTLVMELWDPGDVGAGVTATMSPMRPSLALPRPVVNVPAGDCTYTADTNPNGRLSNSGPEIASAQASDNATVCSINSSTSSGQRFGGEWLRIRIEIPADYFCTVGINPETTAGSCWWGIRYTFSGSANDVTTWQARIEGNPLQLTQ